jgi:hypothetical protein
MELVTESLQGDGRSVKSGNRKCRIPGSLRIACGIRDVEVAGSNPVAPIYKALHVNDLRGCLF